MGNGLAGMASRKRNDGLAGTAGCMSPIHSMLAGAGALLLAAGCTVGPDYQTPDPPAGDSEAGFAGLDSGLMTASAPDMTWWRELGIGELNGLIREAAAHNHELRIARANVLGARAILTQGRLDAYPAVTAGGEITRQKSSTASGSTFPSRTTLYDAGFDAAWELDFFGRMRRSVEALAADYRPRSQSSGPRS